MEFKYNIEVKITPTKLRRGKRAEILVAITNQSKEIAYCEGELKKFKVLIQTIILKIPDYPLAFGPVLNLTTKLKT